MTASLSMQGTFDLENEEDDEHASRCCAERAGRYRFGGVGVTYESLKANRNKHCVDKG